MSTDIETWENEGGSTGKRRAKSILELNYADLEARVLAHTLADGGFIRGNAPFYVGETVTGRFIRPGLRPNEVPAILSKEFRPAYIKPSDRVNVTIEGAWDPKNWPPEMRERMEANQREIAKIIDQRFRAAAGIRDYSAGDVELGTKLHKLFEVERKPYPWWKRVRGWLVWHLWQRWVL